MANRDRQFLHIVTDKSNKTEAWNGAREFDIIHLVLEIFLRCPLKNFFRILVFNTVISFLSPISKIDEFSVAVVDEFNKTVLRVLTGSSMVKYNL
jgi:hypothetical protein